MKSRGEGLKRIVFNNRDLPQPACYLDAAFRLDCLSEVEDEIARWFWRFCICGGCDLAAPSPVVGHYASHVRDVLANKRDETVAELAAATPALKFVNDADRREELARVVLACLNYRPAGETVAQATDRLSSLSMTERRRLLEASRAAERRARAIREALAKKAAEESADKWTRE